jgi:hypothetical protein
MEASGSTPNPPPEGDAQATPPAQTPAPAPATPAPATPSPATTAADPAATPPSAPLDDGKAGGGWRALGLVLALVLAFACAVMVIAMADIGSTPTCDDVRSGAAALPSDNECFDGSSGQKVASLVLGWPSGVLAGVAALIALMFTFTGRRGGLLLRITGIAVVLGALSILIGSL